MHLAAQPAITVRPLGKLSAARRAVGDASRKSKTSTTTTAQPPNHSR